MYITSLGKPSKHRCTIENLWGGGGGGGGGGGDQEAQVSEPTDSTFGQLSFRGGEGGGGGGGGGGGKLKD